jgi:festuclavine dehydrogenase
VKHDNLTFENLERRLQSFGLPEDYSKVMSGLDYKISLNKEHRWNEVIEGLLGRKPKDFRTFAQQAKHVWE